MPPALPVRAPCSCQRARLVGKLAIGWKLPPPCSPCAAWDQGWVVLTSGKRIRREEWLRMQTPAEP